MVKSQNIKIAAVVYSEHSMRESWSGFSLLSEPYRLTKLVHDAAHIESMSD